MEKKNLEHKVKHLKLGLRASILALATAIGVSIYTRPEPEKPNWSRIQAEMVSRDGGVKHFIQRNGSHVYVAKTDYGSAIFVDGDNNGFPELELALIDSGGGWTSKYSNNPSMTSYGVPDIKPISTRYFGEKK